MKNIINQVTNLVTRSDAKAYDTDSFWGISRNTLWIWALLFTLGLCSYPLLALYNLQPICLLIWLFVILTCCLFMIFPFAYGMNIESNMAKKIFIRRRAVSGAISSGAALSFFISVVYAMIH